MTTVQERRQRAHDLPPKWDGHAVTWRGWQPPVHVFICPPPKEPACCTRCGSVAPTITNHGIVAPLPEADVVALEEHAGGDATARLPATHRLVVTRCADCLHDRVWDTDTDEWWDLDETDYVDEGSVPPDPEKLW